MKLFPYTDTWDAHDPHANFKADVAHYTVVDPLPTVYGLSAHTGIPVTCLIRYILAKYATSNADALLATGPLVLQQMEEKIAAAETEDSDAARLRAYGALREIVSWLRAGLAD